MKIKTIPTATLAVHVEALKAFAPDLTPEALQAALKAYDSSPTPTPTTDKRPRFLKKAEVCECLQISLPTLNRYLEAKKLPSVKIGGAVRIPEAALLSLAGVA